MSKLQKALEKLQTSRPEMADGPESIERQQRPAPKIIDHGSGLTADALSSDNELPVTEIDFGALRLAGLLPPTDQQTAIANQYRIIKRPLLVNASGKGAHMEEDANLIMVASALPGDGKTFNCLNLALSMATEKDKSVLLVDADFGKPHISTVLGLKEEPGLIDLLRDEDRDIDSVLRKTNVPGLRVMPSGTSDEHTTELLASRRMAAIVELLASSFPDRIVLFDSPPLLVTSESRVLASLMGQIVLVVCYGRTPQEAVVQAIDGLDQNKAISILLNQVTGNMPESYGYGGYGDYGPPN